MEMLWINHDCYYYYYIIIIIIIIIIAVSQRNQEQEKSSQYIWHWHYIGKCASQNLSSNFLSVWIIIFK